MQQSSRKKNLRGRMSRLTGHRQRWRVLGALLFAAVATGVETSDAGAFPVATVLDEVAEGVAQTVERRVDKTVSHSRGNGRHLGFDTNVYPGDRAMLRWKEVEHYDWVGYYLPAPCHKDPSWSGKRATLEEMGWGIAVVYVGQQFQLHLVELIGVEELAPPERLKQGFHTVNGRHARQANGKHQARDRGSGRLKAGSEQRAEAVARKYRPRGG